MPAPIDYNEIIRAVAEEAARTAIQRLAAGNLNLDNQTGSLLESTHLERSTSMPSKHRFKVTLPTGQQVWASGTTVDEIFSTFVRNYGAFYLQENISQPKPCPTLQAFVDDTYRPSFMLRLKPTTRETYEQYLRMYILPFLGDMKMDEVTVATIQAFYNYMAEAADHGHRKNLNTATISRVRGLTSRIFSVAQEMGIIPDTPFKNRLLTIQAEQSGHHKPLPDDVIDHVKKTIPTLEDADLRLYFGLLAYTGMRREEIMGMRWENIDLSDAMAYVRCTVTYPDRSKPVVQQSAKSIHSLRPILLPEPLIRLLAPEAQPSGYLFGGNAPWAYATMNRHIAKGKRLLGIEDYNCHDFRTTFGTQLKESGLTSAQVADLMGHADTRMVETVYARTREEGIRKRRSDLDRLNAPYAGQ